MKLKCLSIRQPWAWAILHAGKDVENRTWLTKYRGPLAIHASHGCTRGQYLAASAEIEKISGLKVPPLEDLPRGAVVGTVNLVDCHGETTDNDWALGGHGWLFLSEPKACQPLPMKGRLGIFQIDAELRF
jgi:hypothetical protein